MEESLSNEYWKKRCELAESVIDKTDRAGYYEAFKEWGDFIDPPTDTALYTGFIDLLKANDMWYEFEEITDAPSEGYYSLRFWYNGTNFKQLGVNVISNGNIYGLFESGLKALKEITENTKS